jgi:hypothetical protein
MKKQFFCLLVFLIVCPNESKATMVQWKVEDGGNDHFYETIVVTEGITWTDAKEAAELSGGYLATITSQEEQNFIKEYILYGGSGYWIGGYQPPESPEPDGNWQWVTGEEFIYSHWCGGEPSNSGNNEDSIVMWASDLIRGSWNDAPASYPFNGYVLEIPEPATLLLLGLGGLAVVRKRRA